MAQLLNGAPLAAVADVEGVSSRTIRNWLADAREETPREIHRAARLARLGDAGWLGAQLEAGWTVSRIAASVGADTDEVRDALDEYGLTVHRARRVVSDQLTEAALRKAISEGRSLRGIARGAGVNHQVVTRRCAEFGIAVTGRARRPERLDDPDWLTSQAAHSSAVVIARTLGCSPTTVSAAMKRLGITPPTAAAVDARLDDAGWLRNQYWDRSRTMMSIAEELGCSPATVSHAFRRHEIATRPRPGKWEVGREWLAGQYRSRSIATIAAENNVSATAVRMAMIRHNITRRSPSTDAQRDRLGDRGWLEEEYATKSLTTIGTGLGVSASTVRRALIGHAIPLRSRAAARTARVDHRLLGDRDWLTATYATSTMTAIGKQLGVAASTVRRALVLHGIDLHDRARLGQLRRPPQLDDVGWLTARYAQAWSIREIADELVVNEQRVNAALRRHKIAIRSERGSQHPRLVDAVWLAERIEGADTATIAGELGVSRVAVQRALRRNGLVSPYRYDATRLTPPAPERIRAAWNTEQTIRGVARRFEVSHTTAAVWLAQHGIFVSDTPAISRRDLSAAVTAGLSVNDIVARFKVTSRTVIVELHRHQLFDTHRRRHHPTT